MKKLSFVRRNGLSLSLVFLFLVFFLAQTLTGWKQFNEDQRQHGERTVTLPHYLTTGHFIEATAENWESEFLQMAAYVLLTVKLFQVGSSESKDPDKVEEVDRDPRASRSRKDAPWPVRKGGVWLALYEYSLSISFGLLFLVSLVLHAIGGSMEHNAELLEHGGHAESLWSYVAGSKFWFESFQNWQSEFLALLAMVVLSIFLRQRGSPESKPVDAAHSDTGGG